MAVAVRGSRRRPLMGRSPDVRGCLGFDEPLHGVLENAPKKVGVSAIEVVEERLLCHPVLGHRGSPGLGKSFQENSAVAFFVYLAGRSKGHPDLHHPRGHHF